MPIYKVSQWFYIFAGIIRKVFAMYLLWMAFVSGDFSLILTDFRGGTDIKKYNNSTTTCQSIFVI